MLHFCLQVLGSAPLTATSSSEATGHRWAGAKSYSQESTQILRCHLLPSYIPRLLARLGASGSAPLSFLVFYRLEPLFRWSLGLILTLPWILPFRSHPTVLGRRITRLLRGGYLLVATFRDASLASEGRSGRASSHFAVRTLLFFMNWT